MMMKTSKVEDLDLLIENEKRSLIEEYFTDAWNELSEEGIDPKLVAEVFTEFTLRNLAKERDGASVSALLSHLNELDQMGFLPAGRTLQ
ncbi:MAG: hypothetical protein AAF478_02890 [Pseudomonadota bacterium]